MIARTSLHAAFCGSLTLLLAGCGDSDSAPKTGKVGQESSACAGLPEIEPGRGFMVDEGELHLLPGQDGLFCRQVAVPAEYAQGDTFITGLDAKVSLGTHHLIVTGSDAPVAGTPPLCKDTGSGQVTSGNASFQDFAVNPNPLSVIETLRRIAFGGGGGSAQVRLPKGYGKPMPLGFFESSHHVLNLKNEPVDVCGRVNIYASKGEEIEHPLGVIFGNAIKIDVAPKSVGGVEGTVTVSEETELVALMSHAHNYLTRFEMAIYKADGTTGEPVYTSEDWEAPAVKVFDPPLRLAAGDGITFRCAYRNTTEKALKWGVTDGEMCMPFAFYAQPQKGRAVPPTMSIATDNANPTPLKVGASAFGG